MEEAFYPNAIFLDSLRPENGDVRWSMIPPWHAATVMNISPKEAFSVRHPCQRRPKFGTRDRPYQSQVVLSTPDFEEKPNTAPHISINALRIIAYNTPILRTVPHGSWSCDIPISSASIGYRREHKLITRGKNAVLGRSAIGTIYLTTYQ